MEQVKWSVNGSEHTTAIWVEDENGKRVATVRNCENDFDRSPLIAAAPELIEVATDSLECSEILVSMIDSIRSNGNYSEESTLIFLMQAHQCLSKAPAAIAKATGGQS